MKPENMNTNIFEVFDKSTVHGIAKIARAKNNLHKLIWIFTTILFISFCSFLIYKAVIDYLTYDVVTKIRVIKESSIEFPTVTICNSAPIISKSGREYINKLLTVNGVPFEDQLERANSNVIDSAYYLSLNQIYLSFTDEQKKSLSYNFNQTILFCKYEYTNECNENDFLWYYDFRFGNCYRFNTGYNFTGHSVPIKVSTSPGYMNGLIIETFIGIENNEKNLDIENFKGKSY